MNCRALVAASAVAVLSACRSSSGPPAPPPPDPLNLLAEATQHYAAVLKDAPVDSIVAAYTADGELVLPGMAPLHGREAIRRFLTPLVGSTAVTSVDMLIDSVVLNGASAEQDGHYRQVAGPKGGAAREYTGRYHATWRLGAGHTWRLERLTMMPDAPK